MSVKKEKIINAIHQVRHPEINNTLEELGMIRDIEFNEADQTVTLTLVLPFYGIPVQIRNYMANQLYLAVKDTGAELTSIKVAEMNETEREQFFKKEQENWTGL